MDKEFGIVLQKKCLNCFKVSIVKIDKGVHLPLQRCSWCGNKIK